MVPSHGRFMAFPSASQPGLGSPRDDKRHWDLHRQGHQQSEASLREGTAQGAGLGPKNSQHMLGLYVFFCFFLRVFDDVSGCLEFYFTDSWRLL